MYKLSDNRNLSYLLSGLDFNKQQSAFTDIYKVLEYCEDKKHCRKQLLSEYFGDSNEIFECNYMCDNCIKRKSQFFTFEDKDFTLEAQQILDCMKLLKFSQRLTFNMLVNFFRGKLKNNDLMNQAFYGILSQLKSNEIERIILKLLSLGYLYEKIICYNKGASAYIYIEREALNESIIINFSSFEISFNNLPNDHEQQQVICINNEDDTESDDEVIFLDERIPEQDIIQHNPIIEIQEDNDHIYLPSKRQREIITILDE